MDKGSTKTSWVQEVISNEGIKSEVYPKEGGMHVFQAPFTVQEHGNKHKLLLANLENFQV